LPNIVTCLRDSDNTLCCDAIESILDLCEHFTGGSGEDEIGRNWINNVALIELRSLTLDSDGIIRKKAVNCIGRLIILFEKVNGILGIKCLIMALKDGNESVVLESLKAVNAMKPLLNSFVIVKFILPNLLPLLLRNGDIAKLAKDLVSSLSSLVLEKKGTNNNNDSAAVPKPLGITRRKEWH